MDESRRCQATSSRTGEPCRKAAIRGGTVCATHGGSTAHVKRSARQRLDALVEPAVEALHKALAAKNYHAVVKAAVAILDRAGYPAVKRVELQELGEAEGQRLARVVSRAFETLGLPMRDTAVRVALRAAFEAESTGTWQPPAVGHLSPDTLGRLQAEWSGPPLQLIEAQVEPEPEPEPEEMVL